MIEIKTVEKLGFGARCTAAEAHRRVPRSPGYYAIFIDDGGVLPSPYRDLLLQRSTSLIYIGIATVSLYDRLVEQDLQHRRASTFFRAIGSILGYRPPPGLLVGKKNQNNYKFGAADTTGIIKWINGHLSVNWAGADPALKTTELSFIREYRPILNTKDNPDSVSHLAALRDECRRLATGVS